MAEDKPNAGDSSGMNIDTALVRELAELLNETGLSEIEVEDDDRKIRVARTIGHEVYVDRDVTSIAPQAAVPTAAPSAPAPAPESSASVDTANAVKSPMVGTAYLAPEPGKPNFVKIGDTVSEGDTLLIVEAMKVMNPIAADRSGKVSAVLVDNAQPV
ncbi:MAG: acetyl-CoA carboxylase biotin carboxyl carrier protein, partial [Pseudomonadota bacterium]